MPRPTRPIPLPHMNALPSKSGPRQVHCPACGAGHTVCSDAVRILSAPEYENCRLSRSIGLPKKSRILGCRHCLHTFVLIDLYACPPAPLLGRRLTRKEAQLMACSPLFKWWLQKRERFGGRKIYG